MIRALCIIALASFPLFSEVEEILLSKTFQVPSSYVDNYYVKSKDWTDRQKRSASAYLVANVIDIHQTVQITNCQQWSTCDVEEMNPILGNRPSEKDIYLLKGTMLPLLFWVLDDMETSTRTKTLRWINGFQWSVVVWNDYQLRDQYGVELKYKF